MIWLNTAMASSVSLAAVALAAIALTTFNVILTFLNVAFWSSMRRDGNKLGHQLDTALARLAAEAERKPSPMSRVKGPRPVAPDGRFPGFSQADQG